MNEDIVYIYVCVVYLYNGILFSLRKEENPVMCYNLNEYYAMWNKPKEDKNFLVSVIM